MSARSSLQAVRSVLALNCRDAVRLQSGEIDHPLCLSERLGLRLHRMICRWCRRYSKQVHLLRQLPVGKEVLAEVPSGQGLSDEARDRLRQRLKTGV